MIFSHPDAVSLLRRVFIFPASFTRTECFFHRFGRKTFDHANALAVDVNDLEMLAVGMPCLRNNALLYELMYQLRCQLCQAGDAPDLCNELR